MGHEPYPAAQPYQPNQQPYPNQPPNYANNQAPNYSNQAQNYPNHTPIYPNQPVNFNQPPNYPHQPLSPLGPEQKQQMIGTICPYCNMLTTSYTKKAVGTMTWLWCVGLWFFTGICCWIPFVIDDCKEDQIICARCHGKKAVLWLLFHLQIQLNFKFSCRISD